MKTIFTLILFCLLLLPNVGSGQQVQLTYGSEIFGGGAYVSGILIGGIDVGQYFSLPKGSDTFYKNREVKRIVVYDSSNKKFITINFDKKGEYVGWEKDNIRFLRKVRERGVNRKVVMKLKSQHKTLGKEICRSSTRTIFRYGVPIQTTKSTTTYFASARFINQRNADYNRNYYKVPMGEDGEKYLRKRFITIYPCFLLLKQKNYGILKQYLTIRNLM